MNLKGVYDIFYPRKNAGRSSVWKTKPHHRTKQDFFEELIPMEMRWLNVKLWSDKARRSRFFADSRTEIRYLSALKDMILQNDLLIPRMEAKCQNMVGDNICEERMNENFFWMVDQEGLTLSAGLEKHLIDAGSGRLKQLWGNILAFLVLYAIFPAEVNQLYGSYIYKKENDLLNPDELKTKKDKSLFQSEYPPDMSVYCPGEMITHTWILKNVGEVPWKDRYLECDGAPFPLGEENFRIRIPETVYPGDSISPAVCIRAPDQPGAYALTWKMKDCDGNLAFLDKLGVGLHFTVLEEEAAGEEGNNYKVLEESPAIPATLVAGKVYSHIWTIQNTGTVTWRDYYCECINGESFHYTKNELRVLLKECVRPGEKISVLVEFVTPPVEGVYRLVWRILKSDGTPAFSGERRLEVLLNLI